MRLDGKLALDFEHNTLPGTEAYKSSAEPRPVAAWALCKVIPGEGLVYEDIEWTPEGLAAMKGGHFRDLSPSPFRDEAGNVIGLHSVALCRHGEVEGLTLHAAASPRVAAYLSALSADSPSYSTETTPAMKDALLKLLKSLGIELEAEASDEAVTAALSAAATKVGAMKPKEAEGMSAEVIALRAEMADLQKSNLISEATRDGKVIPLSADAIKAAPLSVITELVAAAKPGQVHQNGKTTTSENPEKGKGQPEALSAETLTLAAKMGVTEEEIRKFAPVTA
jgi:phage I-like protein